MGDAGTDMLARGKPYRALARGKSGIFTTSRTWWASVGISAEWTTRFPPCCRMRLTELKPGTQDATNIISTAYDGLYLDRACGGHLHGPRFHLFLCWSRKQPLPRKPWSLLCKISRQTIRYTMHPRDPRHYGNELLQKKLAIRRNSISSRWRFSRPDSKAQSYPYNENALRRFRRRASF